MAKFNLELPDAIMKDIEKIYNNSDEIFGEMTKAGAEVVLNNVRSTAPTVIVHFAKTSKTYKTPSDGGINTKVYFSGYLPFKGNRTSFTRSGRSGKSYTTNKGIPVDFLANIYEYGRSGAPFPKHPFFRKAFNKAMIEQAMLKAQKQASGGLLE